MQLFSGLPSNAPAPSFHTRGRWSSVHHPTLTSLNHTFPYRLKPFPSFQTLLPFFLPWAQVLLDWDTPPAKESPASGELLLHSSISLISKSHAGSVYRALLDPETSKCIRATTGLSDQSEIAEALRCPINPSMKNISRFLLDMTLLSLTLLGWGLPIGGAMQHSSSWIMGAIFSTLKFNYLTESHSRGMN